MDFGPFSGMRGAERNGRKRENRAQNRPGGAVDEVRKFPQGPATTGDSTRDRPRKNPNSDELGFWYWWSRRESNPRPQAFQRQFYILSRFIWI